MLNLFQHLIIIYDLIDETLKRVQGDGELNYFKNIHILPYAETLHHRNLHFNHCHFGQYHYCEN